MIGAAAKHFGITDSLYLCDTFSGVVKAGQNDSEYIGGEHADTDEATVANLVLRCGLSNIKIIAGIFPEQTAPSIESRTFRFAHIDVDVYQSAKDATEYLWPRLDHGGIVVFDDYGTYSCEGVTRFVNEFSRSRDCRFVHNANGHAVIFKH